MDGTQREILVRIAGKWYVRSELTTWSMPPERVAQHWPLSLNVAPDSEWAPSIEGLPLRYHGDGRWSFDCAKFTTTAHFDAVRGVRIAQDPSGGTRESTMRTIESYPCPGSPEKHVYREGRWHRVMARGKLKPLPLPWE